MGPELTATDLCEPTGHICAGCADELKYGEEVVLVQIVQPQSVGGSIFGHPIIDEHDVSGDFLFEPFFFCFECWENYYWELRNETQDSPPLEDELGIIECTCCGSSIREWEYAGMWSLGEFHISRRAPNNVRGPHFEPMSKPEFICLHCMSIFNDNYVVMWDDLSQFGECCDCVLARCWRYGACTCGCHTETTETEEQ